MRAAQWLAILVAAVLGCGGAGAAEPQRMRIPTAAELKQCPKLAAIDWKKVRRRAEAEKSGSAGFVPKDPLAEHRRIRGPRPLPDLSRAEIVLDVTIGPGETQEYPTSTSSFVWKEPGGAWQLSRVDEATSPPSPPPPGSGVVIDAAWNALARRPVTDGPLSRAQAEALDALLADPCFAAQPDVVPWSVPMRKGPDQQCSGFIGGTVRMRTRERVRVISDPCGRGYGFDLSRIVMYGGLDTETWIARAVAERLGREDFELADLRMGKSGSVAQLVCGSVTPGGGAKARFTWKRYMRGPYAEDELVVEGDARGGVSDFEAHWARRCGG